MSDRDGIFAGDDPFAIARKWLSEAEVSEPNDPNAIALATGLDGYCKLPCSAKTAMQHGYILTQFYPVIIAVRMKPFLRNALWRVVKVTPCAGP